jgi:teichoic acid transport system ATP-binding protein
VAETVTPPTAAPTDAGERVPTLVLDDVHVTYHVYEDRRPTLRSLAANRLRRPPSRAIQAVRGVSFSAYEGEAIGVIGGNGAGKSTLFQAMAGLLPVTSGAVYARSQPALLGVGAALQPAVSGRRNVQLGCLALGLSSEQVREKMDEIVAFAGLEEFIDLPLRTYSSGMKARLHFAIATAVEPELLLIDEALSVGDAVFKARSKERIEELRSKAGTVFLVSHSMRSITRTCSRAIWLDKGRIVTDGPVKEVVKAYQASTAEDDD